jgi:hypothetical protein
VLNQIIYRYGLPEKIRVELPRDLTMSAIKKYEFEKAIWDNEKKRERLRTELTKLGVATTEINIKKARLLEESDFTLLYENRKASFLELDELEIDHAYPRSRLYVNDNRNLVLCTRQANGQKGERLLWDFLGSDFSQFQTRVKQCKNMSRGKQAWLCRSKEPDEEWLASQLAATGYIARELSKILIQLGVKVEVSSGKATALLRRNWGLDNLFPDWQGYAKHLKEGGAEETYIQDPRTKNRSDHRHHAIDALVIALTDVNTYQRISRAHKNLKPGDRLKWDQTCPIPNLRKYVIQHLDDIVVTSHTIKKVTGELHKQMPQREDLQKLSGPLRHGEPGSTKVANGKLIRYNFEGKAAQVYPLSNNHHLTIYRSLELNKKGSYDFQAEITTTIEVARRARKKEPIYQDSIELLEKGYRKWLTLEKGEIVEFEDQPGKYYRVSAQAINDITGALDMRCQYLAVGIMDQKLFNRNLSGEMPIRTIRGFGGLAKIIRKLQLNAFGEVTHEVNPYENPHFH